MARKKRGFRRARAFSRSSKYVRRSKSNSRMGMMKLVVGGAIYGAMRSPIAQLIKPLTDMLPLGNISDEAGMMALAVLSKRFIGGSGIIGAIPEAAVFVESARIGEAVATGTTGLGLLGGMNNANNQNTVYGSGQSVYG